MGFPSCKLLSKWLSIDEYNECPFVDSFPIIYMTRCYRASELDAYDGVHGTSTCSGFSNSSTC